MTEQLRQDSNSTTAVNQDRTKALKMRKLTNTTSIDLSVMSEYCYPTTVEKSLEAPTVFFKRFF
jgi:hypothetical protein